MKLAIIGAGYVGLPLSLAFAKHHSVTCYDVDLQRIKELQIGLDTNQQESKKKILKNKIFFSSDVNFLKKKDVYIITVPTPINKTKTPNLDMLKKASILIGKIISKNSTIVYESTTFPGCTEEICVPLIEKFSGLKVNEGFQIGYSPERVNPGDKINTLENITKIIGANNKTTRLKLVKLYKTVCKSVYATNSIKIAESAKVIENIQRDVNIALVNELGQIFNNLKIPTNEVLKAAATKWNFHYYKPGLVGGHCISVDPYYLAYKAKKKNLSTKLILSGRKVNENIGKYIARKTMSLLNTNKIKLINSNVALLGFAFKDNIPDIRNTKVIQINDYFKAKKLNVKIFDSMVSKNEVMKKHDIKVYDFIDLKKFKYDAVILAVSHKEFLKKINFYDRFYKNKNKKIFIDVKNNFSVNDFKKNKYKFFQL
jgi:UDP-N-acetyl-D-glucosamine/UDP-N-acetyl-D-galactosamine dehydrogenase